VKPYDKARLKSGGPEMTIVSVVGEDVQACWFDDDRICMATFDAVCLDYLETMP
jgi:uncharacterized protein YodC (DUF2158 family)